jgi:exopolysaccharide production protein ExoQ
VITTANQLILLQRPSTLGDGTSSQSVLTLVEKLFCIYALLHFSGGMGAVLGNPVLVQLMRYSVLLFSVILLAMRWRTSFYTFRRGGILWLLILWLMFSLTWSLSPEATFDAIKGQVLPYSSFSLYFASRFTIREQLQLIAITLGITTVLCAFYAIALPSIGRHIGDKFDGAWKGIFVEKNTFSGMTTITMLVFYILSFYNRNRQERLLARTGLGFAISLILLSTSMTGLLVFLVLLCTLLACQKFLWRGVRTILTIDILGLLALLLSLIITNSWFAIMQDLGKDPTMSGRTIIWSGTLLQIQKRPWTGYGLEGFWQEGNLGPVQVGRVIHPDFVPAHAHNGFLDMLVDIGWIGFGLFLIGFLITLIIAFRRAYKANQPEDFWPLGLILLMVFYNITETWFLKQGNFFWVMYMTMFLSIRTWPRQSDLRLFNA